MDNEQVEMLLDIGHLMYQIDSSEEAGASHMEVPLEFLKEIIAMAINGVKNVAN